ncbi:MAG: extracellular solute-binding protein, partial [Clostridiaceae bacterium]|nr:extracellular solute-binding protein [Clostridiaceae bacterium]
VYGAQGAFMDLKPLIDEKAPNVKAYIEANPDYKAMVTSSDGAIYGLAIENPLYTNLTFYRSDHFEKAGITELPGTIDEFTEVLRTLKDQYGSATGYYPWVGREGYLHFAECFECDDNIDESGKVNGVYNGGNGYNIYADGFKDMVAWYHTLYSEKLIDPEWVAGTGTEEEWQTKFLTGKGSVSDDFFTRPTWFISNGGPDNDPDYNIEVMDLFKTNSGNTAHRFQNYVNLERYFVISESSKNAEAVMQFLDWLFSEEGQEVMHYGIDGINTEKQADGSYKWIADFAVEAIRPVGEPNIGIYQDRLTFPYPVDNKSYYESLDSRVQAYCGEYFDKYASYSKQLIYTEAQQEERSNLMAKYNTEFTAGVLGFVKGDVELTDDNWKAFLDKMETAGYSQINAIDQEAYDNMK